MRLINIQQASEHFICPVINITIHFDINDRAGCQKAVEAGCLHQSNDWQVTTNARNKNNTYIQKKSKKSKLRKNEKALRETQTLRARWL